MKVLAIIFSLFISIVAWYGMYAFLLWDWCWAAHIATEWRVFSILVLLIFISTTGWLSYEILNNEEL